MICLRLVLGVVVLASASVAVADPPTGSRLGSRVISPGVAMTERDTAVAARDMARCTFVRLKNHALALLNANDRGTAEVSMGRLMREVTCFGMDLSNDMVDSRIVSFPPDIMRGMLAEAALLDARDRVGSLPPLPLEQKRYARPWFEVTGRVAAVDEMGACIADTNPSGIAALIRTEPLSEKESVAFSELNDSLGKCLQAGTRLQAGRQALRAALAEALYQRLRNPALSLPATEAAAN